MIKKILNMRNPVPKILIYPDKRLKRICEPVDFNKTTIQDRINMVRVMGAALKNVNYGAKLGLAAPQVGINKRIIVVQGIVMFNPEWIPTKEQSIDMLESCYSLPGKKFRVTRAKYGWVRYTGINGERVEEKVTGIEAAILQHELDHLSGKCCCDVGEEIK